MIRHKWFGLGLLIVLTLVFSVPVMAAGGVYDPNAKKSTDYPVETKAKEKKGTGKYETFDEGWPKGKPGFVDFSKGQTTGYPDAGITVEKKGSGKVTTFDKGTIHYPGNDPNPADKKPMVKKNFSVMDTKDLKDDKPVELPENVCPLKDARDTFRLVGKQVRQSLLTDFQKNGTVFVISVKERDHHKPMLVGDGFILVATEYEKTGKKWAAKVYVSADYLCGNETHVVYQDDALAPGVYVLDVKSDMVLLSVDGKLAYLRPKKHKKPYQFRMVWDTGIEVEFEKGGPSWEVMKPGTIKAKQNKKNFKSRSSKRGGSKGVKKR